MGLSCSEFVFGLLSFMCSFVFPSSCVVCFSFSVSHLLPLPFPVSRFLLVRPPCQTVALVCLVFFLSDLAFSLLLFAKISASLCYFTIEVFHHLTFDLLTCICCAFTQSIFVSRLLFLVSTLLLVYVMFFWCFAVPSISVFVHTSCCSVFTTVSACRPLFLFHLSPRLLFSSRRVHPSIRALKSFFSLLCYHCRPFYLPKHYLKLSFAASCYFIGPPFYLCVLHM